MLFTVVRIRSSLLISLSDILYIVSSESIGMARPILFCCTLRHLALKSKYEYEMIDRYFSFYLLICTSRCGRTLELRTLDF